MEALKNNLKEQDKRIEDLQEKVNILEAQVRKASIVYFGVNVSVCMFSVSGSLYMEISLLQEQISHLQFVIHSQHQNLRSVIQEVRLIKCVSLADGRFTARRPNTHALSGLCN